ncbi:peptidase inhibitor family I36 protein [Streptomyces scabiei]|uniref:peptidase inhibitor family I36 protein n=1 Tax=Streptomyces scabiei TaxID=1930 RepID=UPI00299061FB|nr:peptidase inhibitor family I36 protein [Streptomyces scabiei]MDW8808812.1 peptidase inhibitor family I36 protein [Streptomyces scabiei]
MFTFSALGKRAAVVAATAAALVVAALPTQASAQQWYNLTGNGTPRTCDGYTLCAYEHTTYNGRVLAQREDGPSFSLPGHYMDDRTSAIVNNSSSGYCFYQHYYFAGLTFGIGGRENWPNINSYMQDKISVWRPGSC